MDTLPCASVSKQVHVQNQNVNKILICMKMNL